MFQISKSYALEIINPRSQERKIFGVTSYLETKSSKTILKEMQPLDTMMIYY